MTTTPNATTCRHPGRDCYCRQCGALTCPTCPCYCPVTIDRDVVQGVADELDRLAAQLRELLA